AAPAPAAQSVACTAPQNPAPQSRPAPSSSAPALSPSFSLQPHPCLSPRLNLLSSRPKWPGLFFRAAFWRAGPRSGGIVATPPPPRAQVNPPLLHSYTLTLLHSYTSSSSPSNPVIPNGVCAAKDGFTSHAFCAMNLSSSWVFFSSPANSVLSVTSA